ncbi:MAG: hypothetical protein GY870_08270 [archaeon]|nr:hypothetical protein [archaeon]
MNIQQYRYKLEGRKGEKNSLENQIKDTKKSIRILKRDIDTSEKVKQIIIHVAEQTQKQLEYHITSITSMAMSSVFPEPYEVVLEFVERRGKTEADIFFERDGVKIKPIDSGELKVGGGAVNVASFALQIALWSLQVKKSRPVLILDEPLKWLKGGDYPEKGAAMIKEISSKLGIQIIMVSHNSELIESADRVFKVKMKKGKSVVTQT